MLAVAAALALLPALAETARAQGSAEVQALMQKVERLQGELNDLQRSVYGGAVPESATPPPSDEDDGPDSGGQPATTTGGDADRGDKVPPAAAVRLQERLSTLEDDLRGLTGNLEETQHAVRQIKDRLDTLVADVDLRLRDIEQRLDAAQVAEGDAAAQGNTADSEGESDTESATDAENGGNGETESAAASDDSAAVPGRQPKSLGQVSADAIADLKADAAARDSGEPEADAPAGDRETDTGDTGGDASADSDSDSEGAKAETDGTAVRAAYKDAFDLLRQADYAKAETAMRDFIAAHPEHTLAGNAQYWLGETFYVREDYEQAAVVFAEGFKKYPESRKAPDNLLKLGMSLARIDRTEDACGIFAELPKRFPDAAPNILQRAERERARLDCDA